MGQITATLRARSAHMGLIFKFQTSWLETWMASIFHRPPSHFCFVFCVHSPSPYKKENTEMIATEINKILRFILYFSGPIAVGLKSGGNFPIMFFFF